MKYNYKYKGLAEKIKEILEKNFPKNKDLTDVKSALLDDDDFINKLTDAVKDNFTLDDMNRMFTKDEICSLIDGDDLYYYFDSNVMLRAISDDTIIRYLEHNGYECELQDDWMPIDPHRCCFRKLILTKFLYQCFFFFFAAFSDYSKIWQFF